MRKKILLIDDDKETQIIARRYLADYFNTDVCGDSKTFREFLYANEYHCLIIDIALHEKTTGLDLIREVKTTPKYSKIPVICLSAHVREVDKQNALDSGADLFLTKPIMPQHLIEKINLLLGNA